jgi:ADP-ribose pyrophosphatase YjhB (NUDIX family)
MSFLGSKIKKLENGREVLEMQDSVNFAMVTDDNYLLLASQFRASNQKESINLFGGYIEKTETWKEALYREMLEESNISKEDVYDIDVLFENKYVSMGYTSEKNTTCIVYLNKSLQDLKLKCNDKDENITIIKTWIDTNSIEKLLNKTEGLKLYLVLKELFRISEYK